MISPAEFAAEADAATVRRLLGLLVEPRRAAALDRIDPKTRAALQSSYLLLDPHREADVDPFVATTLERVVSQLKPLTERHRVEYQGRVRGRVLWPPTTKARYSKDCDPTRYVCAEIKRVYDTPENRLLKYVVERLAGAVRLVPRPVRDGSCYFASSSGRAPAPSRDRLARVEARLNTMLRDVRLRAVETPREITSVHLLRAESLRIDEYADVARFYRRYRAMALSASWADALADAGTRVFPMPSAASSKEAGVWLELAVAVLRRAPQT